MSVRKSFDDTGADVWWNVRENCTWSRTMTATQNNAPVDITGFTVTAKVTTSEKDDTVLKAFVASLVDPANGVFRIYVDKDDADLAPGRYWWAMEWNDTLNDVPLASGPFIVEHWTL